MSTLRITNIEAKADPSSPTVDEKIKLTNSNGDILVHIDGKTSGITTIGINTTAGNIKFDQNSNVVVTGIITATKFVGTIEPTSLEIGSNIKLGNAGVITATSYVGDGSALTGIDATQIQTGNTSVQTVDTGSDGHVKINTEGTERLRIASDGQATFDKGAVGGANQVIARFQAESSRRLDIVWHDSGSLMGFDTPSNHSYIFKTNGTERVRISSAGDATFKHKVSIGDSYTGGEIFKLGKSSGTSYLAHYNGGTANGFIGHADQLVSGGSATDYAVRATSNLIFANGATESVRITPSGYAYFGGYPTTHTVASGSPIKVRSGAGAWGISIGMRSINDFAYIGFTDTNGTEQIAEIYSQRIGASNGHINFSTNNGSGSETRVRISNQGEFTNRSTAYCIGARSIASSSSVNTLYFGAHSSSSLTTGTITYEVYTNGNVKNSNNSYSQLSDERLKENIIDAPSQWDDIKSLRIRKYNFRDNNGYETHTQIGLVAQETESVCPGLVQETPVREDATPVLDADGNALETTKSVSTSVLYMKAVKALQEAQTRIETLETQLTDALARITALEGS